MVDSRQPPFFTSSWTSMSMIRQGVYLAWDLDRPMTSQPNPGLSKPSAVHEPHRLPKPHPFPTLPHPAPATQPHTHGKVDAAKQRMETKPRPTLASSQPSWAHSPNTSQIHWMEPLGQMEKLLAPSVLQTMAGEGGSQRGRRCRCMNTGEGPEAGQGLFYTKRTRALQPWEVWPHSWSCD